MELAARIGTMARRGAPLPYLRRVAYLESHGTEYIDTGLVATATNDFGAKVDFSPTSVTHGGTGTTDTVCITGANEFPASGFELRWQGKRIGGSYGNYVDVIKQLSIGEIYHCENMNGAIKFAGVELTAAPVDRGFVTGSVLMFGDRRGSSVQTITILNGKIFSAEYFIRGDLVRSFTPVLDLSGRPCFYNEAPSAVSATDPSRYFYNQGTGEFTWGELDASSALVSSRGGY